MLYNDYCCYFYVVSLNYYYYSCRCQEISKETGCEGLNLTRYICVIVVVVVVVVVDDVV
jgi:hypothetical protein